MLPLQYALSIVCPLYIPIPLQPAPSKLCSLFSFLPLHYAPSTEWLPLQYTLFAVCTFRRYDLHYASSKDCSLYCLGALVCALFVLGAYMLFCISLFPFKMWICMPFLALFPNMQFAIWLNLHTFSSLIDTKRYGWPSRITSRAIMLFWQNDCFFMH